MNSRRTAAVAALALAIVLGLGLRGRLLFTELWLDEIWSLRIAEEVETPTDLVLELRHDNNHILNTAFLWLLGPSAPEPAYRSLSFASGVLTIALLAAAYCQRPRTALGLFLGAVALSPFHATVSTEARGYAPMLFLALVCFLLVIRPLRSPVGNTVALQCCLILGFLAHLTFVYFLLGLAALKIHRELTGGESASEVVRRAGAIFLLPGAMLVVLYLYFVREMTIGGGPQVPGWRTLVEAVRLTVGWSDVPRLAIPWLLVILCLCIYEITMLRREGDSLWLFFGVSIFLAPALILVLRPPALLYARYFAINVFLVLGLVALAVERISRRGGTARVLAGALVITVALGLVLDDVRLARYGRGGNAEALDFLVAHSRKLPATVGGDHDFRHRLLVEYHRQRRGLPIRYVAATSVAAQGPEWILLHDFVRTPTPRRTIGRRTRYQLLRIYPYGGGSGWNLYLYHKVLPLNRTGSSIPAPVTR